MKSKFTAFIEGVRDILPIQLGIIPFALIAGIAAVKAGMSEGLAICTSVFLFAGASQLAVSQLINTAPAFIVIITAFVINLRFAMYSASITSYFKRLSLLWKMLSSYLLTDQAYAVSISKFNDIPDYKNKRWFYLGTAVPLWVVWQLSYAAGVFWGVKIPETWGFDFSVPLIFIALCVPAVKDIESIVAAVIAGLAAVVCADLPYNLNIIAACAVGIAAGMIIESR